MLEVAFNLDENLSRQGASANPSSMTVHHLQHLFSNQNRWPYATVLSIDGMSASHDLHTGHVRNKKTFANK